MKGNPKSEGRSPKEGRNPKAEIRVGSFKSDVVQALGYWPLAVSNALAAIDRLVSFVSGSLFYKPALCPIRCHRSNASSDFGLRSSFGPRPSAFGFRSRGFTLIELLIVIAVISILAAMVIPITGAVSRAKIRSKARTELELVATGIDLYKAKLGHYPPDTPGNPATNQLYFELLGTTFTNNTYTTLDGSASVAATTLPTVFPSTPPGAVAGIVNATQGSTGDEGRSASPFLNSLKPGQVATIYNSGGNLVKVLISSVPSPANRLNTICYVSSSPTNNPNSYDLWVDVLINNVTNRISNWNKDPIINP